MGIEDRVRLHSLSQSTLFIYKIIIITLLIVCFMLSAAVFMLSKRKQLVVGVTAEGFPVPFTVKSDNISNIINYKQFLSQFLNLIYDWNYDTYVKNVSQATTFMSGDLKKAYLEEIKRGGYIDQVLEYELTSSITIKNIDSGTLQKTESGYSIKVQALKLKITDFVDRTIPVEFEIGFRPTRISDENIWGLEIYSLKEKNI